MLLSSRRTTRLAASLILTCIFICHTANLVSAEETKQETEDFEQLGLHYGKYLKDVVAALDKDQKFTETIKNMNAEDIKSGKVADQLKHVHEDVRKKLNELKYLEIKRLRDLATRKNEVEQYGETFHGKQRVWRTLGASLSELPEHLGSHNNYFDVKDLHKLMVAATNDLEKLDKERKEDFKTYEMEKEWQFQERLKMMNETEKAAAIKERDELKKKHDDHVKVHEPGTKSQFEEVWEKKDHLPAQEFDPKTFFSLHDTNSDNYWDPLEVRQLLTIEIQKIYDPQNPEDDPNEMEEEYERMREHIYKEIDLDRDGLISLQEFLDYSKKPQFKQDNGWEDNSKRPAYSKDDFTDYEKNRKRRLEQSHGYYSPSHYVNQPQNFHLPQYGYGMPDGMHPSQYYQYQVDPNHPQAQHILAAQQQHIAYQQQAYHQQAAAAAGYQQPPQQYHQQPAVAPPQTYQAPPQVQNNQYNQQAAPPQVAYNQQPQAVHQQPQQNIPQVAPQQQAIPQPPPQQQQPPAQVAYQQVPQQQNQAIPQQQVPQQQAPQQQVPQQQVPQQQVPQQQVPQQMSQQQQMPQQPVPQQQAPPR